MRAYEIIKKPKNEIDKQFSKKLRIELSIGDDEILGSKCDRKSKEILVGDENANGSQT